MTREQVIAFIAALRESAYYKIMLEPSAHDYVHADVLNKVADLLEKAIG